MQDITAQRSRMMRDGKRGPVPVAEYGEEENTSTTFTYNGDGTVDTIVKTWTTGDGAIWTKTTTFGYTAGNVTSKTEALEVA